MTNKKPKASTSLNENEIQVITNQDEILYTFSFHRNLFCVAIFLGVFNFILLGYLVAGFVTALTSQPFANHTNITRIVQKI
jgi:hypothetical protein